MTAARILIVSGSALSRNPRVLKEASALAEAGHNVTVLTLRNHAVAEEFDLRLMAVARFKRIVVDVAPAPGASAAGVFLRRLKAATARRASRHLGWESIETIGPAGELLRLARNRDDDLIIGHTEVGLWVAARLLAEGRRVAADFEDWHSEDLPPEERIGRPVRLLREIEHHLLRHAACTTTVCEVLADELLRSSGGRRPTVVANSFPLQPDPRQGPPGEPPAFCWFSQTLGPGRGLEGFLAAWQLMRTPSRLVLIGEDRRNYREELRSLVPAAKRTSLEFGDLVPPNALPGLMARHDVGLALESSASRNRDLAVTNKILQYLNAGLALVATPTSGQREVLARAPEAGIFLGADPVANAAALDELVSDRAGLQARQQAGRRLAENHYSWEHDRKVLLDLVNRTLSA